MESDVFGGLPVLGQEAGSEDDIPHDEVLSVVGARFAQNPRVMPAVQLSHGEEPVERPAADGEIRVLEDPVYSGDQIEECEQGCARSQEHQGQPRSVVGDGQVHGMEARGVQTVEPWCAVVDGVEAPEEGDGVRPAMDPVEKELSDDEGQHQLGQQVPVSGPEWNRDHRRQPARHHHREGQHERAQERGRDTAGDDGVADVHVHVSEGVLPALVEWEEAFQAQHHRIGG